MAPQPPNQPGDGSPDPRLSQYRASSIPQSQFQPGGPPAGGAPMGAPNFRGMAAPPNQPMQMQGPQGMSPGMSPGMSSGQPSRMPAPWAQPQPAGGPSGGPSAGAGAPPPSPPAGASPSGPSLTGMTPGGAPPPGGMSPSRMPAPWMRPQAQGIGMGPAAQQQTRGPQQPGQPTSMSGPSPASRKQPTY